MSIRCKRETPTLTEDAVKLLATPLTGVQGPGTPFRRDILVRSWNLDPIGPIDRLAEPRSPDPWSEELAGTSR